MNRAPPGLMVRVQIRMSYSFTIPAALSCSLLVVSASTLSCAFCITRMAALALKASSTTARWQRHRERETLQRLPGHPWFLRT